MPLLTGEFQAVDAPAPGTSRTSAETLFEEGARAIGCEWARRLDASDNGRRSWLQKVCYQFLSLIIDHGFVALFDERISRLARDRGRRGESVNPFQRGLLAIFAHEKGYLDEADREYFGKRLWYSYRHYVPAPFLLGFLSEVWKGDAPQRAGTNYIEPEFADWVLFKRAEDSAPDSRGKYPLELEQKVALVKMIAPAVGDHMKRLERFRQTNHSDEDAY